MSLGKFQGGTFLFSCSFNLKIELEFRIQQNLEKKTFFFEGSLCELVKQLKCSFVLKGIVLIPAIVVVAIVVGAVVGTVVVVVVAAASVVMVVVGFLWLLLLLLLYQWLLLLY